MVVGSSTLKIIESVAKMKGLVMREITVGPNIISIIKRTISTTGLKNHLGMIHRYMS